MPTAIETFPLHLGFAGNPVGFSLLTKGHIQFAAYYNENRRLVISKRNLTTGQVEFEKLNTIIDWDSHKYCYLAVDDCSFIHLWAGMHGTPLVYYRSKNAADIHSMKRIPTMVGNHESHMTYPACLKGALGQLVFHYRAGQGNNFAYIFDQYDTTKKMWYRLSTVFNNTGTLDQYMLGPVFINGYFHLVYLWRDNVGAETCHDISYIRSKDLISWENAAGSPIATPVQYGADTVVDAIPNRSGLTNMLMAFGLDNPSPQFPGGRPIVTYTKYHTYPAAVADPLNYTELFNARFENGAWVKYKTSPASWQYQWWIAGTGSLPVQIITSGVNPTAGILHQHGHHNIIPLPTGGDFQWRLNPITLQIELPYYMPAPHPDAPILGGPPCPMYTNKARDLGTSPDAGTYYQLEWDSYPANHDAVCTDPPLSCPIPAPTQINIVKYTP